MSEFHDLTRTEAVQLLMKIMGDERRTADEVSALQMAAGRLLQRYCQHRRHKANKRAAKAEANANAEAAQTTEGGVA